MGRVDTNGCRDTTKEERLDTRDLKRNRDGHMKENWHFNEQNPIRLLSPDKIMAYTR